MGWLGLSPTAAFVLTGDNPRILEVGGHCFFLFVCIFVSFVELGEEKGHLSLEKGH